VAALLAVLVVLVGIRVQPARSPSHAIPAQPIQPITRTSPGAQVAWLNFGDQMIAYDWRGRVVTASQSWAGPWRSPDGATVYTAYPSDEAVAFDAATGNQVHRYPAVPMRIVGADFSPDGRYLAFLVLNRDFLVHVIDLQSGAAMELSIPHNIAAATPGLSGGGAWGMLVFGPDSTHLYAVTDWGGPTRLTTFQVESGKLLKLATTADGQVAGRRIPSCNGPAMAAKVVGQGDTLVAFCHSDGQVWFIDLRDLHALATVDMHQRNPFWFSPIFTPDGKRLYLHQWPGFGDSMTMLDLTTRKLYGPAKTPQSTDQPGIFASLFATAYAGGVASTVPLSPDGKELYSATPDGILELRMPDLKVLRRFGQGYNFDEVWVSGDGLTVYGLAGGGKQLVIMNGSGVVPINLPSPALGFIASEHG
jgi:WD40 repeat protein